MSLGKKVLLRINILLNCGMMEIKQKLFRQTMAQALPLGEDLLTQTKPQQLDLRQLKKLILLYDG